MEEVDGLFSSPEKSPTKLNGFDDVENDDSVGSEMSMDEGVLATTPAGVHSELDTDVLGRHY